MFPPSLRFHAVSDDNNSALDARDRTLDGNQVIFTVNLYDFQILQSIFLIFIYHSSM